MFFWDRFIVFSVSLKTFVFEEYYFVLNFSFVFFWGGVGVSLFFAFFWWICLLLQPF